MGTLAARVLLLPTGRTLLHSKQLAGPMLGWRRIRSRTGRLAGSLDISRRPSRRTGTTVPGTGTYLGHPRCLPRILGRTSAHWRDPSMGGTPTGSRSAGGVERTLHCSHFASVGNAQAQTSAACGAPSD
eukprot:scaffold1504_cov417-Prasinococcus_capsulatus_cf.AAC.6